MAQGPQLRVLHFPDWRSGNPYQSLLGGALEALGVEVVYATYHGAWFPLLRALRAERPDALHLHWVAEIAGSPDPSLARALVKHLVFRLDVSLARRLLRGRLFWTVHNLESHESPHPRLDRSARRFLAQRAAALIAHGPTARDLIVEAFAVAPERVHVVPMGNYLKSYPDRCGREEGRRRLGIPEGRFVFLFLGSLRPYKGIEQLLQSFDRVRAPNKYLIVSGAAPDAAYLKTLRQLARSGDVRIVDRFVPDDELQFYFSAADAVVLPFTSVLTSASLVLAMGYGKMVVTPRLGCIPDYTDPRGSLMYDPTDPDALRQALESAAGMDVEAAGNHNRELARRLEWRDAADRTIKLYAGISRS